MTNIEIANARFINSLVLSKVEDYDSLSLKQYGRSHQMAEVNEEVACLLGEVEDKEYGTAVELACCLFRNPGNLPILFTGYEENNEVRKEMFKYIQKISKKVDYAEEARLDGICIMSEKRVTLKTLNTAWRLFTGNHEFTKVLNAATRNTLSTNGAFLVFSASILRAINFPYTSLSNLLASLGRDYVDTDKYLDDGYFVGKNGNLVIVYTNDDGKMYKVMGINTFEDLYFTGFFDKRIKQSDATENGIVKFKNGGRQ